LGKNEGLKKSLEKVRGGEIKEFRREDGEYIEFEKG